ncbi:DNase I-like protein [Amylocystis lapponica]|nr:DNase I-like protein [Amylocystis lapponica]
MKARSCSLTTVGGVQSSPGGMGSTDSSVYTNGLGLGDDTAHRKVLVVVTHPDSRSGFDQGCIFIFKLKQQRSPVDPLVLTVEHVFPILGQFSISMAQPRQTTLDLAPQSSGSALNQPRKEFTLTVTPGHDPAVKPLSLTTYDTEKLRLVLAECKRLKEASVTAVQQGYDAPTTYPWIAPYVLARRRPHLMSSVPPDLRMINKPLYTQLSPASAGSPGDEVSDIDTIREDWINTRAQQEATSAGETATLRLRLGTFNVNGKMPSQDLSAWVRGRPGLSGMIPPLKNISPLSLGEVVRNPLEKEAAANHQDNASLHSGLSGTTAIGASTSSLAPLSSASATTFPPSTGFSDVPLDVTEDPTDPDMLVLAFQELDLSTEALLYSTKTFREDAWCTAAFAALGEKAVLYEKEYFSCILGVRTLFMLIVPQLQLASKQLVGMLLIILVKKRLRASFTAVKSASAGAGIMGVMGNKGATALRLAFTPMISSHVPHPRPTILTFVNSHLAAFDEMYEKRNTDFHDLSRRLIFDSGIPVSGSLEASSYPLPTVPLSVYETDALFWMVHLNYRIELSDADVRTLLSSELGDDELPVLLEYDQLRLAIRTKKAFEGFAEHPITHAPSYRFGSGGVTDHKGYDLKRRPAWTDRILRMCSAAVAVEQLGYSTHAEITMSDHRPVSADFVVNVPLADTAVHESSVHQLWRSVAHFEDSDDTPQIQLSSTTVDFGMVSYRRRTSRTIDICNVGKIPCAFRFVAARLEVETHPSWVHIEPMTGLVLPGEQTSIRLTSYADKAAATRMNLEAVRLEDTLILHTALGKDHFILITGEYERTCYAATLLFLSQLPGPIRALKSPDELLPVNSALTAPREIMRLVNWLMSNAISTDGLFMTPGEDELVYNILECLDTGADFAFELAQDDPRVARAFAESLVQLLASLSEPVVPVTLHSKCIQMTSRDEAFELLGAFPSVSVNVWISVTAFLHFIGQQSSSPLRREQLGAYFHIKHCHGITTNRREPHAVAKFSSILLRDDPSVAAPVSAVGKRNFLRYFLA